MSVYILRIILTYLQNGAKDVCFLKNNGKNEHN
jgi:hypothetical protein